MAAVTHAVGLASTDNVEVYTTGAFTPVAGDLLICQVRINSTDLDPTVTTSDGLTFTQVSTVAGNGYIFVADQLANAVSQTLSADVTGDAATGCGISVERVSGMTRTGANAVKQASPSNTGLSGTTPSVTFSAAVLTGNPTYLAFDNNTNPAGVTPPTGWTELFDSGHATPNTGYETASRDSGFTGTEVTWGSTSASAWEAIAVELDASATYPGCVGGMGGEY